MLYTQSVDDVTFLGYPDGRVKKRRVSEIIIFHRNIVIIKLNSILFLHLRDILCSFMHSLEILIRKLPTLH